MPLYLVDAFSNGAFTGNPAAVCTLDGAPDEQWMANVAMEMNQPETAFLWPEEGGYRLRWLTPTVEVDLCGHATLASAHILFETGQADGTIHFHTRSGTLTATKAGDEIELDFPIESASQAPLPHPVTCLGVEPIWTGKSRMDWVAQLHSADQVRAIRPDYDEIAALGLRGLIVTGRDETDKFDFVSRCFFPASGIPEDPVTGSAHCTLAAFWGALLGRAEMTGFQASARGGIVKMAIHGDRAKLRGRAVTTLYGNLRV